MLRHRCQDRWFPGRKLVEVVSQLRGLVDQAVGVHSCDELDDPGGLDVDLRSSDECGGSGQREGVGMVVGKGLDSMGLRTSVEYG